MSLASEEVFHDPIQQAHKGKRITNISLPEEMK